MSDIMMEYWKHHKNDSYRERPFCQTLIIPTSACRWQKQALLVDLMYQTLCHGCMNHLRTKYVNIGPRFKTLPF